MLNIKFEATNGALSELPVNRILDVRAIAPTSRRDEPLDRLTAEADQAGIKINIPWRMTQFASGALTLPEETLIELQMQIVSLKKPLLLLECDTYVIVGDNTCRVLLNRLSTPEKISMECCKLSKKPWWTEQVHHTFYNWAINRLAKL